MRLYVQNIFASVWFLKIQRDCWWWNGVFGTNKTYLKKIFIVIILLIKRRIDVRIIETTVRFMYIRIGRRIKRTYFNVQICINYDLNTYKIPTTCSNYQAHKKWKKKCLALEIIFDGSKNYGYYFHCPVLNRGSNKPTHLIIINMKLVFLKEISNKTFSNTIPNYYYSFVILLRRFELFFDQLRSSWVKKITSVSRRILALSQKVPLE